MDFNMPPPSLNMMFKVKQAMHMGQAELSFSAMKVEAKCKVQGVAIKLGPFKTLFADKTAQ